MKPNYANKNKFLSPQAQAKGRERSYTQINIKVKCMRPRIVGSLMRLKQLMTKNEG